MNLAHTSPAKLFSGDVEKCHRGGRGVGCEEAGEHLVDELENLAGRVEVLSLGLDLILEELDVAPRMVQVDRRPKALQGKGMSRNNLLRGEAFDKVECRQPGISQRG